jgi:hypothetical protein
VIANQVIDTDHKVSVGVGKAPGAIALLDALHACQREESGISWWVEVKIGPITLPLADVWTAGLECELRGAAVDRL